MSDYIEDRKIVTCFDQIVKYLHNNCQTGLNKGLRLEAKDEQRATWKFKSKFRDRFFYFLSSQGDIKETLVDRVEVSAMMVSEWVDVLEVGLVGCHHLIIIDLIHPQHCHPENNTSLHCPFNFTKLSGTIRDKSQRHGVNDWWNDNGGQG